MSAEDQINMLKQIPPLSKEEKRRKIRTALVLLIATFISLLFFVFAYLQKLESDKQRVLAETSLIEAQRQEKLAKEAQVFAEFQRMAAEKARQEAEKQHALLQDALENCKKSNR